MNLAGMLGQGGYDNPEYPWRRMEEDLARTQMIRQLQAEQDERLKRQELERGIQESKAKEEELFRSMLVRQLQGGWGPPPGVDIGGFSKGGGPMQYKAIGPGTQGPQNIQKFDEQWSRQPELDDAAKARYRQYIYKDKTPAQLETPEEKAARDKQHQLDMFERQHKLQEESLRGAETRQQKYLEQRDKEIGERASLAESAAEEKSYRVERAEVVKKARADEAKVRQMVLEAKTKNPYYALPKNQAELNALAQIELNRIQANLHEGLYDVDNRYGRGNQKADSLIKARKRFVGFDHSLLQQEGADTFDKFEAAARAAGIPIDVALDNWEMYEKEVKRGKSK